MILDSGGIMNRMDEKITLEEAVDYSKIDISTIDFSKVEGICDARYVRPTRNQYKKIQEDGCLVGLTEESYGTLSKAFIDYVCDEE